MSDERLEKQLETNYGLLDKAEEIFGKPWVNGKRPWFRNEFD
jgi:hypothetical protein